MQIGSRALQVDYDLKSDTLFLYSDRERSKNSAALSPNLIVDFARNGTVVGLEFLNATETIYPLLIAVPKKFFEDKNKLKSTVLQSMIKASTTVNTVADFFIISFTLYHSEAKLKTTEELRGNVHIPMPSEQQMETLKIIKS